MKISQLFIYPIKSCGAIACNEVQITPKGLAGDREFMIVNDRGQFMTQRQYPQMALVRVKLASESITLEYDNFDPLVLKPTLEGQERAVTVWRSHVMAIDQGEAVAQWLQMVLELDRPCRLVRQSPRHPRSVNPQYAITPEDTVSFADGYPLLLTNTASLTELNRRLAKAYPEDGLSFPMNRFRPNVVVESNDPFIEDTWKNVTLAEVQLAAVKPCDRCIVTTTDQTTGQRHPQREPLKTLATFRQQPGGIMFGQNLIPQTLGQIQVGASVIVSPSNSHLEQ